YLLSRYISFFILLRRSPISTLFPYTTLFRSDWNAFEPQLADERPVPFSFATEQIEQPQITCYIGYTTDAVHNAIRSNIHESPLRSEEHTSELQSLRHLVCRLLLEKKKKTKNQPCMDKYSITSGRLLLTHNYSFSY